MRGIETRFLSKGGKPVALTSPTSYDLTEFAREERKQFLHLAVLNEPEKAFKTIRTALNYRDRVSSAKHSSHTERSAEETTELLVIKRISSQSENLTPLNELKSKALIKGYGISVPAEGFATTTEEAVSIAENIGYPVVVKAVASTLIHKSDAGGVLLNLQDAKSVEDACGTIAGNVTDYDKSLELDGWLVSKSIQPGLELVIGIQNDPEMGPVIMFGTGGVLLELISDVAFAAPGLDLASIDRLISSTRIATLIDGYRGDGPYDRKAVIDALIGISRLATDAGEVIESLDINPFVVLPKGQGALALDALAIIRPEPEKILV